jgi:hypothetical protein
MTEPQPAEYARPGLPSWQAPIIGAIVVIVFGLQLAGRMERPITALWVAGSGATGALIGLLVALCDGPGPGTLVSRFLALISPATALLPIFGVPFTAAAYFANRRHPGVYRTISQVAFVGSLLFSLVIGWMLIVE